MLDSPRSASPTSPTPDFDQKEWQCLYFCRYPGCNKGYASTDGVRKHCRKHHADWLADLDERMRENNQKHSAATYCSTQPAEPAEGEFAAPSHVARKRQRADSGSSSIGGTPSGTPRLDPTVPRRPEPVEFAIGGEEDAPKLKPVRTPQPTKEDIFALPLGPNDTDFKLPRPAEAPDRPLLKALAALDERPSSSSHRSSLSQNFFALSSGMPVPKRGPSLLELQSAELARECDPADGSCLGLAGELTDLNSDLNYILREDGHDGSSAEQGDSIGFITDVWA